MLRLRLGLVLVKAVGYYEYKQNIMPTLTTGRNRMFYFFLQQLIRVIYTILIILKSVCLYVGVRKLQGAIIARSSREMYLTVRIVGQCILSRVRVSVRSSSFFIREKHPYTIAKGQSRASFY